MDSPLFLYHSQSVTWTIVTKVVIFYVIIEFLFPLFTWVLFSIQGKFFRFIKIVDACNYFKKIFQQALLLISIHHIWMDLVLFSFHRIDAMLDQELNTVKQLCLAMPMRVVMVDIPFFNCGFWRPLFFLIRIRNKSTNKRKLHI